MKASRIGKEHPPGILLIIHQVDLAQAILLFTPGVQLLSVLQRVTDQLGEGFIIHRMQVTEFPSHERAYGENAVF